MIELRGAALTYMDHGRPVHACREVSLTLRDGEFLGVLGPSGSGKSSLLYLMCGLKTPSEGSVLVDSRPYAEMDDAERSRMRLQKFGFVFQHAFLVGYLTALENVLVACPGEPRRDEALELMERLGLGLKAHRHPHELSGGERQRVCIARALLGERRVIFADEPTANLDHATGTHVVEQLIAHRGSGSLVVVTHDPSMVCQADRVVRLSDGVVASIDDGGSPIAT